MSMTSSPSSEPTPAPPLMRSATLLEGDFTIGVDLGQSRDPTAIAIVHTAPREDQLPVFSVGHLERLPLDTPYPSVVRHVLALALRGNFRATNDGPEIVIDFTGVGRPVFDMFKQHDGFNAFDVYGVSITAGDTTTKEGRVSWVPKRLLISGLMAALHDGRLKILKTLTDAAALIEELQSFQATVTESGYWRFGARAGKHDDLVLALAIAVYRASESYTSSRVWLNL